MARLDVRALYDRLDTPVTEIDCGKMCAPRNPSGKPFCCDICQAVPAVYRQEWDYLRERTDLWRAWRGDECPSAAGDPEALRAETPEHMLLLACRGPAHCQRHYRALSCRQFPFFPYISTGYRFTGLAGEWAFAETCWVLGHLDAVTAAYRRAFVETYDALFALWPEEFDSYAILSDQLRAHYEARRRRFPLLHRNGKNYRVSPGSERMERVG
jgi:hypothetical protein